jgi:hypothetical protein
VNRDLGNTISDNRITERFFDLSAEALAKAETDYTNNDLNMDTIKNLLSRRIKQSGLSQQVGTALLVEYAEQIIKKAFGEAVAKKMKPLYFKTGILNVACLSSVAAQEFNFKKQSIIKELNQKWGQEIVKDIRLII